MRDHGFAGGAGGDFADRAMHDVAERAWLQQFIGGWLKRMPISIVSEAAE